VIHEIHTHRYGVNFTVKPPCTPNPPGMSLHLPHAAHVHRLLPLAWDCVRPTRHQVVQWALSSFADLILRTSPILLSGGRVQHHPNIVHPEPRPSHCVLHPRWSVLRHL
jgi:hypothetical protein